MSGTIRFTSALAVCLFAFAPAGWAGTSSGLGGAGAPSRGITVSATVQCAISLTIAPQPTGSAGTSATALAPGQGFTNVAGAGPDLIAFGNVNPTGGSAPLATTGGDQWKRDDNSGINVIGAIKVTIIHSCGTPPTATIAASAPPAGVTVRYDDVANNGIGWQTSDYQHLTGTPTFPINNGLDTAVDIGFKIPPTQASGAIGTTVTIATAGGS
ncbi:MAG: hypothetical protein JRI25_11135 [Deltaproteobacteria bacterium]|nr:hypothetical protein [Deltaproteobacteria bacterium]